MMLNTRKTVESYLIHNCLLEYWDRRFDFMFYDSLHRNYSFWPFDQHV